MQMTSHATSDPLVAELSPRRQLDDLILSSQTRQVVDDLVEEQHRADLLRSHNLEPRHRVLLAGPPGNGKTSLAEAIADALSTPFLVVRYEAVVGSYLGETARRIEQVFEYARSRRCVLFFDEFDAIGKERGDLHETGEIKRVVSSLPAAYLRLAELCGDHDGEQPSGASGSCRMATLPNPAGNADARSKPDSAMVRAFPGTYRESFGRVPLQPGESPKEPEFRRNRRLRAGCHAQDRAGTVGMEPSRISRITNRCLNQWKNRAPFITKFSRATRPLTSKMETAWRSK